MMHFAAVQVHNQFFEIEIRWTYYYDIIGDSYIWGNFFIYQMSMYWESYIMYISTESLWQPLWVAYYIILGKKFLIKNIAM